MSRLALLAGLMLSSLLALAVAGVRVPDRDSARASHLSRANPAAFLLAYEDAGALARERFDPLLGAAAAVAERGRSFDVERALAIGLSIFFYYAAVASGGAGAPWSAAAAAAFAVAMVPVARLGHPLWMPSPWLVLLVAALAVLGRAPASAPGLVALLALLSLRASSELFFRLALPLVAGFALFAGGRTREHAAWSAVLVAVSAALYFVWPATAPPPPWAELQTAAPVATVDTWIAHARPLEIAVLAPFAVAAMLAAISGGGARAAVAAAAVLGWASLDLGALAYGLPPLRPFRWLPDGAEYAAPILFVVAAAAAAIAGGAGWLSRHAPALAGAAAAVIIAGVISWGAAPSGAGVERGPAPSTAPMPAATGGMEVRAVAWPLAFAPLAERLERRPDEKWVNVDPIALGALARFLPPRPNTLWTEAFWVQARAAGINAVGFLHPPPDEHVPWEWLEPLAGPTFWGLDVERALGDFTALERLPADGWTVTSNGANPALLPESAALDGQANTRWGSGRPQSPGLYYEIDLGRDVEGVRRGVLDGGTWRMDFPRSVAVDVALEDGGWKRVAWDPRPHVQGRHVILDFAPRRARRVRFVELESDPVFDWSIAEVSLWRSSGVSPAGASDRGAD